MRKQRLWGGIWIGSLLIVFAGISPVMGENNKLGGTERPVMEALETPSLEPVDWAGTTKISEAIGAGGIPATVPEELSEDDLCIPEDRWVEDTYPDD